MKRLHPTLLFIFACLISISTYAQQKVIYNETFGVADDAVHSVSTFDRWSETASTHEGNGRIYSNKNYLCTLPGSSSGNYLYFPSSAFRRLVIGGINTSGYTCVKLVMNVSIEKGEDALEVDFSTDGGITFTPIAFDDKSKAEWGTVTSTTELPAVGNLQLRFQKTTSTSNLICIDDLKLVAEGEVVNQVPSPTLSHQSGTYYEPFDLVISCSDEHAIIRYTTDGSIPTESSLRYNEPLKIIESLTITAIASVDGVNSEAVKGVYQIAELPTEEEALPAVGTILVLQDEGEFYAVNQTIDNKGALGCVPIYSRNGKFILTQEQLDEGGLRWTIDSKPRLKNEAGTAFLSATKKSGTTNLGWYTTASSMPVSSWRKGTDGSWQQEAGNTRALLRSGEVVKLYAISNLGRAGYSETAATDTLAYLGYAREVTPGTMSCICLPYDVAEADMGEMEVYSVKGKRVDAEGKVLAVVLDGPHNTMKGGTPYFVRSKHHLAMIYSGRETTLPTSCNGLVGTFEEMEAPKNCLVVSDGNILTVTSELKLDANTAYLVPEQIPVVDETVNGLELAVDGSQTQIEDIARKQDIQEGYLYTLTGIRLMKIHSKAEIPTDLPHGIYIWRGQKIVLQTHR